MLKVVETRLIAHHSHEQPVVGVEDAQDTMLDVDVVAHLI
jgi:hypothetical protein